MKNNVFLKLPLFLSMFFYGTYAYSNVVWPALFVADGIFSSLFVVIISIAIEALLFYWLLTEVSLSKAFFISLIGNLVSTLIGTVIMTLGMLLWHFSFDQILGGTFSIYNIIASYMLMYLGSSLIELVSIRLFFKYSAKQLWIPVFSGNFLTYALVALFRFHNEIMMIVSST